MRRQLSVAGWFIRYSTIRSAALAYRRFKRRLFLRGLHVSNRWFWAVFLVVVPIVYMATVLVQRTHTSYHLLTGPKGGTYDEVGPRLAAVLNKPNQLERILHLNIVPDFIPRESCGSLQNLYFVNQGAAQLGFVEDGLPLQFESTTRCALAIDQSDLLNRGNSTETRLRALMPLYRSPLHIVARKRLGFSEVRDIRPHTKVYLGPEGSATAFLAHLILNHYGIVVDRVGEDLNYEQAVQQVRDGRIEVGFFVAGLNGGAISRLSQEKDFQVLKLEHANSLAMLYPFLEAIKIPASTLQDASQEITTVGTNTILVASSDLTEIEAYEIATKIARNIQDILHDVPLNHAKTLDSNPQKELYYTLHDGAVRFYSHDPPFFLDPRTVAGIGTYLSVLFVLYSLSSQFRRDYVVYRFLHSIDRAVKAFKTRQDRPAAKRFPYYLHRLKQQGLNLLKEERITMDDFKRIDEYIKGRS